MVDLAPILEEVEAKLIPVRELIEEKIQLMKSTFSKISGPCGQEYFEEFAEYAAIRSSALDDWFDK